MPAYYRASVAEFLGLSESELTGRLSIAYASSGFQAQRTSQTLVWQADILRLQTSLAQVAHAQPQIAEWTVLFEFEIPRKEKRIDVVLLAGDTILLLELKSSVGGAEAARQAEEYALLLHYFHQPSHRRRIVPLIVVPIKTGERPRVNQQFLPIVEAPAYWIEAVKEIDWSDLVTTLAAIALTPAAEALDGQVWNEGEYRPVPSIIEAATSLQEELSLREIAHSRAEREDVIALTSFIDGCIEHARTSHSLAICFITGVPGSGKTLVGLNLAFGTRSRREPIHFMSGNGPLVMVLQTALAVEHQRRTKIKAHESRLYAKTLIENVHVFARHYTDVAPGHIPSNHVIIFDEAQRAWDRAQNYAKFKRDYSEPEMLLRIMERHSDWAVVVALVGGGQEINSGEAGLGEWGRALASATDRPWQVYASPEALTGGSAVAGSVLLTAGAQESITARSEPQLHLKASIRSLRAGSYAEWVDHVVRGDVDAAAGMRDDVDFPILITRSLTEMRAILRHHARGHSRAGLAGSSKAGRLRAEGLEPDSAFHGAYDWDKWYLAPDTDVRASSQLEVYATEFEIQGLELDWIGLCWGGDFLWSPQRSKWLLRNFHHARQSRWTEIKSAARQTYRRNAYRVLLTRARQGIVLFVPQGDAADPTRVPEEFHATAEFLLRCGARVATQAELHVEAPQPTLFEFA